MPSRKLGSQTPAVARLRGIRREVQQSTTIGKERQKGHLQQCALRHRSAQRHETVYTSAASYTELEGKHSVVRRGGSNSSQALGNFWALRTAKQGTSSDLVAGVARTAKHRREYP